MPSGTRFKLRVCTWNVGNAQPPADLSAWLGIGNEHYDIIVIGAQEANYSSEKPHTPSNIERSNRDIADTFFVNQNPLQQASSPSKSTKRFKKLSRAIRIAAGAKSKTSPANTLDAPADAHSSLKTLAPRPSYLDGDHSPHIDQAFHLKQTTNINQRDKAITTDGTLRKAKSDLSNKLSSPIATATGTDNTTPQAFDDLDESLLVRRRRSFDRAISPQLSDEIPVLEHNDFYQCASTDLDNALTLSRKLTIVEADSVVNHQSKHRPPFLSLLHGESFQRCASISQDPPPALTRKCALANVGTTTSPACIQSTNDGPTFSQKASHDGLHSRITRRVREHISSPKPWLDDTRSSLHTDDAAQNGLTASGKFNRTIEKNMPAEFHLIAKHHLMEIKLLIYVHDRIKTRVVRTDRVAEATGIGNVVGNKGGVAVKLTLDDTTFCFVSCHLAAHEGAKFLQQRNADVFEIMRNIDRNKTHGPSVLHQYDHLIWLGDLNYRLDLKRILPAAVRWSHEEKWQYVTELIALGRYEDLVLFDELIHEMENGHVFGGFTEGRIRFAPTFKVSRGKELEYQRLRLPSYCDRIVWHSLPLHRKHLRLKEYESVNEFDTSDHKPIFAVFEVVIPAAMRMYGLPAARHTLKCTLDFAHLTIHGLYEKKAEEERGLRYEILEDGALAVAGEKDGGEGAAGVTTSGAPSHTRRMVRVEFHGNGLFVKEKQRSEVRLNCGVRCCGYDELPKIALRPVASLGDLRYKYVTIVFARFGSKQGSSCLLPLAELASAVGQEGVVRELQLTKYGQCIARARVQVELVVSGETWIDSRNRVIRLR